MRLENEWHRIDIDLAQFNAGRIPSSPLVEIKP